MRQTYSHQTYSHAHLEQRKNAAASLSFRM